ncbi:MAG: GNAT family N-acetyltransferase [Candidatus Atribacteria bacterium]|nr:MAG: GNAT family N-acetyltransferase [Candidatus Atribacteria bacterium]
MNALSMNVGAQKRTDNMKKGSDIRPSKGWEIVVAQNFEEVEAVRDIWVQMQQAESITVLNANIDRYLTYVESMEGTVRPHVIILYYDGDPKAMVIGRIERHQIPCRLGYKNIFNPSLLCLTVVYGGILGQPDEDASTVLVRELMNLLRQRKAGAIFFSYLRTDSNVYKAVRGVPGFWGRSHFPTIQRHWETQIPRSLDGMNRLISRKYQRKLNRCIRNLEKASGPLKLDCYRQKKDIEVFVRMASQVSLSSYQAGLGCRFVNGSVTRSILNQLQRDGWLRAYVLYSGSEPIAFEYGCVIGDRYFAESAAYDARFRVYGPGTILQVKIFEQLALENGVVTYDYGFGDATYKQRFGDVSWSEASVYIFAHALYPIVINLMDSSVKGLSIGAANLMERLKLTAKIKRWWKNHLLWTIQRNEKKNITSRNGK